MYLERQLSNRIRRLFEHFPAIVLVGARQVGKSTLLRALFGGEHGADCVVFDPVLDIEQARADPELFFKNHRTPLILDEIQYAPELVPTLKRLIDKNRKPGQYILTGSQQWGVLKTMSESLAGRAVVIELDGFALPELGGQAHAPTWLASLLEKGPESLKQQIPKRHSLHYPLYEQIWRGFLPEAQFLPQDLVPAFHASYRRTYIERDVRLLADVSDLHLFGRFVQLASALTAQEINTSQLGRELGIAPQTARRWLEVLKGTFQWFELPAFSRNAIKRVSLKSKGYISDTGMACSAQSLATPNVLAGYPLWGALFESAVVAEIRKLSALLPVQPILHHWRSHGGAEVDVLIEYNGKFFPIEIKGTSRPTRRDTRGFVAFRETYPHMEIMPGLIIAPAETFFAVSEVDYVMPWDWAYGMYSADV